MVADNVRQQIIQMRVEQKMTMHAIAFHFHIKLADVSKILTEAGHASNYRPSKQAFWQANEARVVDLYTNTSLSFLEMAKLIPGTTAAALGSYIGRLVAADKLTPRVASTRRSTPRLEDRPVFDGSVSAIGVPRTIIAYKPPVLPSPGVRPELLVAFTGEAGASYSDAGDGCRWPIGKGCCGAAVRRGSRRPYCEAHAATSLRPGFSTSPLPSTLPRALSLRSGRR